MQLGGVGDVAVLVLGGGADVEHHGVLVGLQVLRVHGLRAERGQSVGGGDVPARGVDPHPDDVAPQLVGLLGVLGEEDQAAGVGLRVDRPAGVGARLAGGEVDGAFDGAVVDVVGGAGVDDDEVTGFDAGGHLLRRQLVQLRQRIAEHGGAVPVLALHPPEVRRRVGLAVEEFGDEALLVVVLHVLGPPRELPLVTHRAGRQGPQGLAAGRARAVGREHLDVVGQGEEALAQAGEQLLGAVDAGVLVVRRVAAGGLVEQVRSAEVTTEHEVAGERVAGLVGERAVGDEEHEVLGRVAGGVHGLELDVAELDGVAVAEPLALEAIAPVVAALVGEVDGGAGRGGQLAGAGQVVGVDVGLGDLDDGHAVLVGHVEIGPQVAAGVHDDRLAAALAADEVAGVGQVVVIDAFEKHCAASFFLGGTGTSATVKPCGVSGYRSVRAPSRPGSAHWGRTATPMEGSPP